MLPSQLSYVLLICLLQFSFISTEKGAIPCFWWDTQCTSHYGVDFPGNDISIMSVQTKEQCCNACKDLDGCMQWVMRPELNNNNTFNCHLKSKFGFPDYCDECWFSHTQSDTCIEFCKAICHNLGHFGPSLCGTDGYTYESPCQAECHAVDTAHPGPCDDPNRDNN